MRSCGSTRLSHSTQSPSFAITANCPVGDKKEVRYNATCVPVNPTCRNNVKQTASIKCLGTVSFDGWLG
jgi:hypothetical protein